MASSQTSSRIASDADDAYRRAAAAENALTEANRTIRLLQQQLHQTQELVLDLRGRLNQAARRD